MEVAPRYKLLVSTRSDTASYTVDNVDTVEMVYTVHMVCIVTIVSMENGDIVFSLHHTQRIIEADIFGRVDIGCIGLLQCDIFVGSGEGVPFSIMIENIL